MVSAHLFFVQAHLISKRWIALLPEPGCVFGEVRSSSVQGPDPPPPHNTYVQPFPSLVLHLLTMLEESRHRCPPDLSFLGLGNCPISSLLERSTTSSQFLLCTSCLRNKSQEGGLLPGKALLSFCTQIALQQGSWRMGFLLE